MRLESIEKADFRVELFFSRFLKIMELVLAMSMAKDDVYSIAHLYN